MPGQEGARAPRTRERQRGGLETGDLVLFSGRGLISAVLKHASQSRWSHVGLVLRGAERNPALLWESTALTRTPGLERGRPRRGVQLVPLGRRVRDYRGIVVLRRLLVRRSPAMDRALRRLRGELQDRPYEHDMVQLLRAAYEGPGGQNHQDLRYLFCSELVAEAYQAMGLLPPWPPSSEYTPRDFSSEASASLPLLRGARLAPELLLKG